MKAINKIACFLSAVAVLMINPSCEKVLNTPSPSTNDEATVFSNYSLAEYNIFSISEVFGHTNCYRGRYLPWYGFNNDVEWYNGTNAAGLELAQYNTLPNNSQLNLANGPYNEMYIGVERANLCIHGLRTYGNVENDMEMAYLLGEALTMRALLYFDLIKGWGDVPARFEPVDAATIYVPKSDRDVIYKQILADLEEAFNYLPMPNESAVTTTTDRVSRAFAKGLYARIALAASGYALRPDDGAVGTGNQGSVRLSADSELSKEVLYPKALAALQEVIDNAGLSLVQDYQALWYGVNNFDLVAGKEIIFVIPFGDGRGRWNFTFGLRSDGASITNGVSRGGEVGPVPTLYFDFDANDVRRDLTCVNWKWTKANLQAPAGIGTWYFGKYRFEWMDTQPYTGGNDDGVKPVYMRYSDILLMAAEISNELGDLSAAKGYLLPVRTRAFKGNEAQAEAYVSGIGSKEAMFQAIVDERAFEFTGEFLRKGDLIRWNLLKTNMDAVKEKMLALSTLAAPYDFMSGNIYYKEAEDEKSIIIWGLKPGENAAPEGDDWTAELGYISNTKFKSEKIAAMYQLDPNTRQYWPIFDNTLTNSQGTLVNDYGY